MSNAPYMANTRQIAVRLTEAEYALISEEATRGGISLGLAIYRRAFGVPTATRKMGRPPRIAREQTEELPFAQEVVTQRRAS